MAQDSLAEAIAAAKVVSEPTLAWSRQQARRANRPIYEMILERSPTVEGDLWRVLAAYLGVPYDDLAERKQSAELAGRLASNLAFARAVAPLAIEEGVLTLAVARPETLSRLDEIAAMTGLEVQPVLTPPTALGRYLQGLYGLGAETVSQLVSPQPIEPAIQVISSTSHTIDEKLDSDQQASITRFVNQILMEAIRTGASDIHVEPYESQLRVRFRLDGLLQEVPVPPHVKQLEAAIISRIKVLGDLDIAEKRLGQDGQMRLLAMGRPVDVRVSVLPTIYGEALVLRILDRQAQFRRLDEIGMAPAMLANFRAVLDLAQGLVLVTGPTGSGKTTTLYAALNAVNQPRRKIVAMEDPVEYRLEGISQVQVKESIGLSFSSLLRNIVRHDPDVIMVGEIRDSETASLALNSAMTGHLVFSTLHTNDAPSAVTRLLNMAVPPYLIAAALKVVLAQRLVRVLCPHCREVQAEIPAEVLREFPELAGQTVYRPAGCERCRQTGYHGRIGVFEFFVATDAISEMILEGASVVRLRAAATHAGMQPLRKAGMDLVVQGRTSIEEVYRVTREAPASQAGQDGDGRST